MHLRRLMVDGLRSLQAVDIQPAPHLNLLVGANGAGKTSVLEAIHLLSRGRSFRHGGDDALLQRGAGAYQVFAEVDSGPQGLHRLGLGRLAGRWQIRVDGESQATLGELLPLCAVVCFEPGSHELLSGSAQVRRRFLDWGVFHVEHAYLDQWRRSQRALKQRNQLLRGGASAAEFLPWERELALAAHAMDNLRHRYLRQFEAHLAEETGRLAPSLGAVRLHYRSGWPEDIDLAEHLDATRSRDLARGHTSAGPHRADWRLEFESAPDHQHLSRGQEKLAALACMFAQAAGFADSRGGWPIVCLDDLASELDADHQARVLERLTACAAQVWITGTQLPLQGHPAETRLFHVEHGRVIPA